MTDFLNLTDYEVKTSAQETLDFFSRSTLLEKADLLKEAKNIRFSHDKLIFDGVEMNAYFASVAADFIRTKLIEDKKSFSFETVMSSPDKIELLRKARAKGYRTYLYYVATEDFAINIARIRQRVKMGGHPVPEDKVASRYQRSLDLLLPAVQNSNRAYIFDNSGHELIWLAEITNGKTLEMKNEASIPMPLWFRKSLWEKFHITQQ